MIAHLQQCLLPVCVRSSGASWLSEVLPQLLLVRGASSAHSGVPLQELPQVPHLLQAVHQRCSAGEAQSHTHREQTLHLWPLQQVLPGRATNPNCTTTTTHLTGLPALCDLVFFLCLCSICQVCGTTIEPAIQMCLPATPGSSRCSSSATFASSSVPLPPV